MFKKIASRDEQITPRAAQRYLLRNVARGQRKPDPRRVAKLRKKWNTGLWTTAFIEFAKDPETRQLVLVNGQNALTMISQLEGDDIHVSGHINEWDCPTRDDLADLFSQFDSLSGHSIADIYRFVADRVPWLKNLPEKCGLLAVRSLPTAVAVRDGHRDTRLEKDERIRQIRNFRAEVEFLHEIFWQCKLDPVESRAVRRGPVAVAILLCFWKNPAATADFFGRIITGDGCPRTTPQHKLRDYLLASTTHATGHVYLTAIMAKCIIAYNAWMADSPTRLQYYPGNPFPTPRSSGRGKPSRSNGRGKPSRSNGRGKPFRGNGRGEPLRA